MRRTLIKWLSRKSHHRRLDEWEKIYGEFDKGNYDEFTLSGLPNESTYYHGEIIKWAQDITPSRNRALLAGESNRVVEYIRQKIKVDHLVTTGLSDVDYKWDFEENPPCMGRFELIISHAILEHLLNPYKHINDLTDLLSTDGFLIVHSVCPGFHYHRYPIDACRFFPDWFEEIADRLPLTIIRKRINDTHIFYMYQRKDNNP